MIDLAFNGKKNQESLKASIVGEKTEGPESIGNVFNDGNNT